MNIVRFCQTAIAPSQRLLCTQTYILGLFYCILGPDHSWQIIKISLVLVFLIICICFLVILSICGYFYSASFSDNILSNCIYSFQPSPASLGESPQHRDRIAQVGFVKWVVLLRWILKCSHQGLFSRCFQNCKSFEYALWLLLLQSNIKLHEKVLHFQIDCNRERRNCPQVSKPRPIVQIREVISKTFNCKWSRWSKKW